MKKYLVFLLTFLSFTSLFSMDHSGLDKGKERVFETIERPVESFELTEDVWVETNDGVKTLLSSEFANKLETIVNIVEDLEESSEAIPLPEISNLSLARLIEYDANNEVLNDYLFEDHIDLFSTAFFLDYSAIDTIADYLIDQLLSAGFRESFLREELDLGAILHNDLLRPKLIEKIERLSMISCLQKDPRTLSGHRNWITSVCVSPDGRSVITGSADSTAKIWDITTGECKHTLSGHTHGITSVCVSPDSSYVVTGSDDHTGKIWDITTDECKHTLSGHTGEIRSVCVSPDGRSVITDSYNRTAKIWDITTGACNHTLSVHAELISSVCVSPDGRSVITGSNDRTAKIWDITTGECKYTLSGHTELISSVCVSPDGRSVITGSLDGTAKIWDITTGECKHTLSGHTRSIRSVCVSPDNKYVITGSDDRTAKIWDITTGECKHTLSGHTDWITSVCVSPDSSYVITGSYDRTAKIWDITTGECKHTLLGHTDWIRSVCVSPDGRSVITGSYDRTAKIWQLRDPELEATLRASSLEQLLLVAYSLMYPEVDLTTDYAKTVLKSCPKNVRDFVNSNIPRKWLTYATLRNGLLVGAADVFGGYKLYQWYKGSE